MTSKLSRRELEELRKKKEEEAAAHVFQEFVETFQEAPAKSSKVWIKAGTYDAGSRKEDTSERGKVYKPQSRLETTEKSSAERTQDYVRLLASSKPDKPHKRKDKDKKKSNLELFKEELRQIQEEREERHKYKSTIKQSSNIPEPEVLPPFLKDELGSFDYGDPNTTNLYLGNLSPKLTEQQLMEIFGRYGPLASIKIMWPRSEEEKARGRNCGFVAYMCRKDGERALRNLNGKEIMSCEMKMGWGKAVAIPPHPIYIPPVMLSPPPMSGLPFNAQPPKPLQHKIPRLRPGEAFSNCQDKDTLYKILSQSIVKVVIPEERKILMLIHRMVEFVIREGPMFEAMIMNKEINNPQFRFLFENQSPNHIYYRWKLFSLLQGDTPKEWSTKEFRMFKGGSIWRPPGMNYTYGMPEELVDEEEFKDTKGTLSKTQRERLEDLIRQLTPERWKVGEAMVFCIEHSEAADEIADCIAESLSMTSTAPYKKAARMYLLSDVLHNSNSKGSNASYFKKAFEIRLIQIMHDIYVSCERQENHADGEGLKARIQNVLRTWLDWHVYSWEFLQKLFNALHGIDNDDDEDSKNMEGNGDRHREMFSEPDQEDIDGEELEEGGPLDGAALLKAAQKTQNMMTPSKPSNLFNDIDGVPLDDDIDGIPLDDRPSAPIKQTPVAQVPGFIPSKWETVGGEDDTGMGSSWKDRLDDSEEMRRRMDEDDDDTEGESMHNKTPPSAMSPDNNDSGEVSDERRQLLRTVELRAMQYQDEIESGTRPLKSGWTIHQQVQHYRRKLIKKAEKEAKEKEEILESPERDRRYKEKERERDRDVHREIRDRDRDRSDRGDRERDRERDLRDRGRSVSSEEEYTSSSSSKRARRSRERSYSPSKKRYRSRSPRKSRSARRTPSPPPAPLISVSSSSTSYYTSSRRSSELSSSSSSRKHKHKHKY